MRLQHLMEEKGKINFSTICYALTWFHLREKNLNSKKTFFNEIVFCSFMFFLQIFNEPVE